MFHQVFSQQWMFDRCLEVADIVPFWVPDLCLALVTVTVLYFIFRKRVRGRKKQFMACVISFVLLIPLWLYLGVFVGYSVCSDYMFWQAVAPAHQLHALLKLEKENNGRYPHTQAELSRLDPVLMRDVEANAETIYIYNAANDTYTWFVRPSMYYVAVFDSQRDYALYSVPQAFNPHHWDAIPLFPPNYPGPWKSLPE